MLSRLFSPDKTVAAICAHVIVLLVLLHPCAAAENKKKADPQPGCRIYYQDGTQQIELETFTLERFEKGRTIHLDPTLYQTKGDYLELFCAFTDLQEGVLIDCFNLQGEYEDFVPEEVLGIATFNDYTRALAKADKNVAFVDEALLKISFYKKDLLTQDQLALQVKAYLPRDKGKKVTLPRTAEWYTYTKDDANGFLTIDGKVTDQDEHTDPIDSVPGIATSGHPDGMIDLFVFNDFDKIYFALDCTVDNTENPADSLTIICRYGEKEKTFIVPAKGDQQVAGFCLTDTADYPHRYYELVVPVKELDYLKGKKIEFKVVISGIGIL